ncbi:hypothetical protein OSB04_019283 [Centaurea solstitialis]|uniref:Uncharacterized protein n=1 Tax=Centaurea solstitialis TaxID=347529 RepID=A0AA38WC87_9ASTR|nr:hypothetical protein OSB04_019283 [Centaurea solstitialis]
MDMLVDIWDILRCDILRFMQYEMMVILFPEKQDKLNGPNHLDWIRTLRISLAYENKEYLLDEDLPILNDEGKALRQSLNITSNTWNLQKSCVSC